MSLPFFYHPTPDAPGEIELDEDTSRHVVQVLRMKPGDLIHLTDGRGQLITAGITRDHKKHCLVSVRSKVLQPPAEKRITIGISLLKNTNRFEWFLEKATEIGVAGIIPLLCARTEKEKFRQDRLKGICISAMLQSRQTWLPELGQAAELKTVIPTITATQKFLAHCENSVEKKPLSTYHPFINAALLLGPEGDFTKEEIDLSAEWDFIPVSLGKNRLRTETAGIVAASLLLS